jgi:F-type H+-transporting ATPase subunit d
MASKRLAASTVEWAEFARKIPEAQKVSFFALKAKQDGYVRTINSLPEKIPAIDWSFYKTKVTVPGKSCSYFCYQLVKSKHE